MTAIRTDFQTPYSNMGRSMGNAVAQAGAGIGQAIKDAPAFGRRAEMDKMNLEIKRDELKQVKDNAKFFETSKLQVVEELPLFLEGVLPAEEIVKAQEWVKSVPHGKREELEDFIEMTAAVKGTQQTANGKYGNNVLPTLKFDSFADMKSTSADEYSKMATGAMDTFENEGIASIKETLLRDATSMGIKDKEGFKAYILKQNPELFESPVGQQLLEDKAFIEGAPFESRAAIEGRGIQKENTAQRGQAATQKAERLKSEKNEQLTGTLNKNIDNFIKNAENYESNGPAQEKVKKYTLMLDIISAADFWDEDMKLDKAGSIADDILRGTERKTDTNVMEKAQELFGARPEYQEEEAPPLPPPEEPGALSRGFSAVKSGVKNIITEPTDTTTNPGRFSTGRGGNSTQSPVATPPKDKPLISGKPVVNDMIYNVKDKSGKSIQVKWSDTHGWVKP